MSIQAMEWVLEGSRCKGGAFVVLLMVAWHADKNGDGWPSVGRLARLARLSERGVQRALRELERSGALVVEVGAGPGGVNRYRLPGVAAVEKSVENGGKRGPPGAPVFTGE